MRSILTGLSVFLKSLRGIFLSRSRCLCQIKTAVWSSDKGAKGIVSCKRTQILSRNERIVFTVALYAHL